MAKCDKLFCAQFVVSERMIWRGTEILILSYVEVNQVQKAVDIAWRFDSVGSTFSESYELRELKKGKRKRLTYASSFPSFITGFPSSIHVGLGITKS